jgi:hypothetical protein
MFLFFFVLFVFLYFLLPLPPSLSLPLFPSSSSPSSSVTPEHLPISSYLTRLVMLSHEPLRQSLDVLAKGGRIGMWTGSQTRMFEDIKALRPTVFGATPTLWQGSSSSPLPSSPSLSHSSPIHIFYRTQKTVRCRVSKSN